ncbi:unnamed protein product [Nippostrongylus brasiliensis]|uniref:PP28 domain-containing protein n=1 Tax=Nippostrongylus brasiliensis TaxID=27835 RepID=A0A0N4YED3_NIPBR|nr:hypothetical protein Q1695_015716 [Nippostrongylus brasiliensis]VDL78638.1 unnamed protein product [Nippostrongylus brasiliensis]
METGKGQTGETVKPGNSAERRKGSENDLDPEPAQEDAATVEGQPPEIALSKDQLELATDEEKLKEGRKGSLEGGAVLSGPGKSGEYKYKEKYREQRKRDAIAREKLLKRQKFHR